MTTLSLLAMIAATLRPPIEAQGGQLSLCLDANQYLEQLAISPVKWRAILTYEADVPVREDVPEVTAMIWGDFLIAVQQHAGLPIDPSSIKGAEQSLLAKIELVRTLVRGLRYTNAVQDVDPVGPAYLGFEWVAAGDGEKKIIRSAQLKFRWGYSLNPCEARELVPG